LGLFKFISDYFPYFEQNNIFLNIITKTVWKIGRAHGWIVKRFGKCRRKQWKDKENKEEMYVELWNELEIL
jgi:hypothetical protein